MQFGDPSGHGQRNPVLWSLSRRSGSLFQAPLFAALNVEGCGFAVCSPESPARDVFIRSAKLIDTPVCPTSINTAFAFALSGLSARHRLSDKLKRHASIVHVTMSSPIDAFYLQAAKAANVPIILTLHDSVRHLGETNRILDAIDRRILKLVDHIAVISDFVFRDAQARQLGKPIHHIAGGLLTREEPGLALRKAPEGRLQRILFLGRIHEYKGLALLLDSIQILAQQGRKVALTVAGSGDLSPYQSALENTPHLTIINDWIDEKQVLEVLRKNDILALPYLEASQSGVAIDAQWAAMPAVATPVGALPEQFIHGHDAIISESVTPAAFASALSQILDNNALYERLSAGAQQSYKDKGLVSVAAKWRDLYAEISSTEKRIL